MLLPVVRHGARRSRHFRLSESLALPIPSISPQFRAITAVTQPVSFNESYHPRIDELDSAIALKRFPTPGTAATSDLKNEEPSQSFQAVGFDCSSDTATEKEDHAVKQHLPKRQRALRTVLQALQAGDAHGLLKALLSASQDPSFFKSLPPTTFAEIIRSIKLDDLIDEYITVYQYLHPWAIAVGSRDRRYHGTRKAARVFGEFNKSIQKILDRWLQAGNHYDLLACKTMLRVAALTGYGDHAGTIWSIMKENGVEADTEAYNYLLQAKCWNGAHTLQWGKLRITPLAMLLRQSDSKDTKNHWARRYQVGPGGLKGEVIRYFDEMVALGLTPDSSTFYTLITALAREGDLKSVASVLKRAWDIDVEAIMNDDEGSEIFEHSILPESPILPDKQLLFIVAHAYGSNNQIATALRVVDHISRKFSLTVDMKTWSHLALWTFIVARPTRLQNSSHEKKKFYVDSQSVGKVPSHSVEQLWRVCTSDPYNIKPTIEMHNWRIKSLWLQEREADMIEAIREAWRSIDNKDHAHEETPSSSILNYQESKVQGDELQRLRELGKSRMKIRWISLMLSPRNKDGHSMPRYFRQVLPHYLSQYIEYWNHNHTNPIAYTISSGRIQFHPSSHVQYSPEIIKRLPEKASEVESKVVVSHLSAHGLNLVQPSQRCKISSYQGLTGSVREARKRANAVQAGLKGPAAFDSAWHEMPEVKDWIWVTEEDGYRLSNGVFRHGFLELNEHEHHGQLSGQ